MQLGLGDSLNTCGEWEDRDSLDLPGGQLQLLEALITNTTTPIIVILVNARAATFGPNNTLLNGISALLEAWRPGQMGAQAVVNIIMGRVNPSGKLQSQWAQNVGQMGSGAQPWLQPIRGKWIANHRTPPDGDPSARVYDAYVGSPYLPLFRFGHGLSYTTFAYKSLNVVVVTAPSLIPQPFSGSGRAGYYAAVTTVVLNATVNVCNSGTVDGTEVVQVSTSNLMIASI